MLPANETKLIDLLDRLLEKPDCFHDVLADTKSLIDAEVTERMTALARWDYSFVKEELRRQAASGAEPMCDVDLGLG